MVNYDKMKVLAKNQGISFTFLCKKVGKYPGYIADLQRKKLSIPEENLKIIADTLNCSVAYLKDETDVIVDEDTLDEINEIDDDLLQKCGDIYHAKIAQEERNKANELYDGEDAELVKEFADLIQQLSDDELKSVFQYIEFLLQKRQ